MCLKYDLAAILELSDFQKKNFKVYFCSHELYEQEQLVMYE